MRLEQMGQRMLWALSSASAPAGHWRNIGVSRGGGGETIIKIVYTNDIS